MTVVQKVQRGTERYTMVEKVEVPSDSDASHVSILLSGEAAPIEWVEHAESETRKLIPRGGGPSFR